MNRSDVWNRHYRTDRSRQRYPDENLVRLLSGLRPSEPSEGSPPQGAALDYGFGSGRHLALLMDFGYAPVCGLESSSVALGTARHVFQNLDLRLVDKKEGSQARLPLPWPDKFFSVIICWGVLHYLEDGEQQHLLREFRRLLAPEGAVLGTLRSSRDSHFAESEVADTLIQFYDENAVVDLFRPHFEDFQIGHMERTPLGRTQLRISHWFFRAMAPVPLV